MKKCSVKRKIVHLMFIAPMYSYVTSIFVHNLHITMFSRVYSYVTGMYSFVTRMYSCALVCTRMYSCVLVCTRVYSSVLLCHLCIFVCYSYVLVWCFSHDVTHAHVFFFHFVCFFWGGAGGVGLFRLAKLCGNKIENCSLYSLKGC